MGITIVVEGQRPLSSEHRRLVEKSLQQGDGVSSRSGQTLAYAVAWCEKHKQPYMIAAVPGVGYRLKQAPEEVSARRDGAGHDRLHAGK
jgi:hypothetical protein